MLKLITGFVLGVVVTLAVVFWLDSSDDSQPIRTGQRSTPASASDAPRSNATKSVVTTPSETLSDQNASNSVDPASPEELSQLQAKSRVTQQPDARPTSATNQQPTSRPQNDYPPEIADMIENSVDKELQARYENDEREESWATYMEGLLGAYFAQKPALAQFYFSLIDCRTSVCEIHALGYGVEALTQWNTATADMVSQPWFEFNNMSMNRRNPEPDILAIVLILTKRPPD